MILRKYAVVVSFVLMLAFAVAPAGAERPPEPRESADHVITGVIEDIHTERSSFGRGCLGSGTRTDYTARIKVDKVEKGTGIQVAKTIEVRWFHVTRQPLDPPPGAYGHGYHVARPGAAVRVYLMDAHDGLAVIYSPDGMEASARAGR